MTKLVLIFFLLISGITNAQLDEKLSLNTEYILIVETICEETSQPDPCAGQEVYLILKFKKRKVYITQKMVSSCGEETIQCELKYKWKLENCNQIIILSEPKEIKYSSLENLILTVEDKIVYGHKNIGNNQSEKYVFINKSN